MNNVFVFVLIIIISSLVLLHANMKMNILEKSPFSISVEFLYFSLFLHFNYFCISSIYIFLINFCFSVFLSSGVFISVSVSFYLFFYLTLLLCFYCFSYPHFISFLFTSRSFSSTLTINHNLLSVCWYFFLLFFLFLFLI